MNAFEQASIPLHEISALLDDAEQRVLSDDDMHILTLPVVATFKKDGVGLPPHLQRTEIPLPEGDPLTIIGTHRKESPQLLSYLTLLVVSGFNGATLYTQS